MGGGIRKSTGQFGGDERLRVGLGEGCSGFPAGVIRVPEVVGVSVRILQCVKSFPLQAFRGELPFFIVFGLGVP